MSAVALASRPETGLADAGPVPGPLRGGIGAKGLLGDLSAIGGSVLHSQSFGGRPASRSGGECTRFLAPTRAQHHDGGAENNLQVGFQKGPEVFEASGIGEVKQELGAHV